MERCAGYIVACLAALKAGGAFLPLELAYPDSLLEEVISDSGPPIVLTKERYAARLPKEQRHFCMDEGWDETLDVTTTGGQVAQPGLENLLFVAYSSGTTGKPKGVANPHRAAVRSYRWRFGLSDYHPGDRVWVQRFLCLGDVAAVAAGATTVVIPDDVIYDPRALVGFLEEHEVTETLMTSSLMETVLNANVPDLEKRLSR